LLDSLRAFAPVPFRGLTMQLPSERLSSSCVNKVRILLMVEEIRFIVVAASTRTSCLSESRILNRTYTETERLMPSMVLEELPQPFDLCPSKDPFKDVSFDFYFGRLYIYRILVLYYYDAQVLWTAHHLTLPKLLTAWYVM
jgi:hypothetical protein